MGLIGSAHTQAKFVTTLHEIRQQEYAHARREYERERRTAAELRRKVRASCVRRPRESRGHEELRPGAWRGDW